MGEYNHYILYLFFRLYFKSLSKNETARERYFLVYQVNF